jgi:quercetin dioxygenase-like cupin family protein
VSPRHLHIKADDLAFTEFTAVPGAHGARRAAIVSEDTPGAVHTGFGIAELEPGGRLPAHVHSYEDTLFVLEGEGVLDTADGAFVLRPGDYGVMAIGAPHALRNVSHATLRWANMVAPQPRARCAYDTYAVPALPERDPVPVDVRDPRTRSFGHVDPAGTDPHLVDGALAVTPMIDQGLGAHQLAISMVRLAPRSVVDAHDHPYEEAFLILEGEVEATFAEESIRMGPGDVAWAGVGCVHAFANAGPGIARCLATQAPQSPVRDADRVARHWESLRATPSGG